MKRSLAGATMTRKTNSIVRRSLSSTPGYRHTEVRPVINKRRPNPNDHKRDEPQLRQRIEERALRSASRAIPIKPTVKRLAQNPRGKERRDIRGQEIERDVRLGR